MTILKRRLHLLPDDGGGAADVPDPKGGDDKKGAGPADIPYPAFKKTNDAKVAAEAKVTELMAKISGFDGWVAPADLQTKIDTAVGLAKAEGKVHTEMADARVRPEYRAYMAGRVASEKPTDVSSFLAELAKSEAAFFDVGVQQPKKPHTTPEGGTGTVTPPKKDGQGDKRALTGDDIAAMDEATYAEQRDSHLKSLAASRKKPTTGP